LRLATLAEIGKSLLILRMKIGHIQNLGYPRFLQLSIKHKLEAILAFKDKRLFRQEQDGHH
jgi:hypothetical protein